MTNFVDRFEHFDHFLLAVLAVLGAVAGVVTAHWGLDKASEWMFSQAGLCLGALLMRMQPGKKPVDNVPAAQ